MAVKPAATLISENPALVCPLLEQITQQTDPGCQSSLLDAVRNYINSWDPAENTTPIIHLLEMVSAHFDLIDQVQIEDLKQQLASDD